MYKQHLFTLLTVCLVVSSHAQRNIPLVTGRIIYDDKQLEEIIPRTAQLEVIGSGFQHIEGPVWLKDSSCLLFSDTKAALIYRWSPVTGLSKFLDHTGYTGRLPYSEEPGSNGLAVTKDGLLIMSEHGDRRIATYPLSGKYGRRTLTDNFKGKRYNSPNDIVIKSDGSIYFTDPPYGLPQKEKDSLREINVSGVYRINTNGLIDLLIDDLPYPNGLAFSPDEKRLYISNSDEHHSFIMSYPVTAEGLPLKGKIFFDAASIPKLQEKQVTDGLKIEHNGVIWAAGPGGVLIVNPGGKLIGRLETYEVISNLAWDDAGTTLYLTAGTFLYRLKVR